MCTLPYLSELRLRPIKGNVIINNVETPIFGNISSPSSIFNPKEFTQQGQHITHLGLCLFTATRNILNSDLDRRRFGASKTAEGEDAETGCNKGEILKDGFDRKEDMHCMYRLHSSKCSLTKIVFIAVIQVY